MSDYIEEYFDYLKKIKKVSDNTFESYHRDIIQYKEYIKNAQMGEITGVSSTVVLNYLLNIQKQGKSAATASRSLAAIRSLYRYLCLKSYVKENPTENLHSFKSERKLPNALSDAQIDLLLDLPECRNVKGYRDRAMLEIMYATGMKSSDMIRICIQDVNLKIGFIKCNSNNKERIIPVYAYARDCLQEYIDKRSQIKNSDKTDVLFLNLSGEPLTRQGLWKILKSYQKKLGLPIEITPHTLRHSFAIHLLENGADLKSVQELMGHNNISSTQIYEQIVKNKLSEVYSNSHPRSKYHK